MPDTIAQARQVVLNGHLYGELMRRLAWSVLVTARDGRVRQSRLGRAS